MKRFLILFLVILGAFIFNIPEYRELNNIAIIEGIAIEYDGANYTVYLKEVIPVKSDRGIDYEYKYYKERASSIDKAYKEISSNTKKKLYLKRCKFLISNLYTTNDVIIYFDINPTTIYHSKNDIYDKLKSTH